MEPQHLVSLAIACTNWTETFIVTSVIKHFQLLRVDRSAPMLSNLANVKESRGICNAGSHPSLFHPDKIGRRWIYVAFSFWVIVIKSLAIFSSGLWNYGSFKGLLHPHRIKYHTNTSASPALRFCEKVCQSFTRHSQESSKSPNYYDYVCI